MSSETLPTVAEVRQIITTGLSDADIGAIIEDAALIVGPCIEGMAEDRAKAIIKYATADLIASTVASSGGGARTAKALGDASESYASGGTGAEFGKSAYWSKALLLDTTGCLANLGRRRATLEKV